jgi:hypothetical protein
MPGMDRRKFIQLSLLASGAAFGVPRSLAGTGSLRLTLRPDKPGDSIPEDFTGLSYETAQLHNPTFFSAANTQLAGFVRRLGASGVLRIGGNTSAYSVWTPKPSFGGHDPADSLRDEVAGPDTGKQPAPRRAVTPLAIRNLRDFLDATGWRLIYGLNMGSESPETAADEAEYVAKTMGSKLIALQLCNEPDLFYRNDLRAADYGFEQFAVEWQRFFDAVRARVPGAPFAGPDTAYNNEWLVPFAQRFKNDVLFLSQHYYAEGPPDDPSMTIERLLSPNPRLQEEFEGMARTHQETGLPFRMAETNSCYQGGKPSVSDTFASALWGADLMYQLAAAGGTGINFHGGGYGWYTPIAGTPKNGLLARPLYYGMLLFAEAGPGTLVAADIDNAAAAPLLTAYGLSTAGAAKAVLFNKNEDRDVVLTIDPGTPAMFASVLRLYAPRVDDTADTTLGGAPVGAGGAWSPAIDETIKARSGMVTVHLPKASGALVTFG